MWVCLVSSLSGHPLVFLYLYICFLLSVGEVFSHSFFKYIFDPHLSSLFRTPIMHRLSCFTLSHRSCMLLSFFFFHLSVYCSDCVISLFCLPDHLFIFLHHLVCYSLLSGWFLSWQLSCLILTHSSLLFLVPCYSDLLLYQ